MALTSERADLGIKTSVIGSNAVERKVATDLYVCMREYNEQVQCIMHRSLCCICLLTSVSVSALSQAIQLGHYY